MHLLAQVKDRNWQPEMLKRWGAYIGASPFNIIVGIMDGEKTVGVFWGTVDPVSEGIFINVVSVDKEYQDGKVIQRAVRFFKDIGKELGLSRVFALSSRAKAGLRLGWKDTKLKLMEV